MSVVHSRRLVRLRTAAASCVRSCSKGPQRRGVFYVLEESLTLDEELARLDGSCASSNWSVPCASSRVVETEDPFGTGSDVVGSSSLAPDFREGQHRSSSSTSPTPSDASGPPFEDPFGGARGADHTSTPYSESDNLLQGGTLGFQKRWHEVRLENLNGVQLAQYVDAAVALKLRDVSFYDAVLSELLVRAGVGATSDMIQPGEVCRILYRMYAVTK